MKKTLLKKNNLKKSTSKLKIKIDPLEALSMDFISAGIACQALCLLDTSGILKKIIDKGSLKKTSLKKFKNSHLIKSILVTLVGANILFSNDTHYFFTDLGYYVAKKIGFITLPLEGYKKLIAKQTQLLHDPKSYKNTDIDFSKIAQASIQFGEENLDPLLLDIFRSLKPKGTICDLGCGTGEKLVKICKKTHSSGLGIEQNRHVIKESKKYTKNSPQVDIIRGSIDSLKGVWEDVTVAMISFVFHDIPSKKECSKMINSYLTHFPRLHHLIVVDIVSPSPQVPTNLPGFDYVHGLQGFSPRNYEETLDTFIKGQYNIDQEIVVPNMPNTFIWILSPQRN